MTARWYAVAVEAGHERAIAGRPYVRELGLDLYVPLRERWIRRRADWHLRQWPLFPGYLFARMDLTMPAWVRLLSVANVVGLVRAAGAVVAIRDQQVEDMRRAETRAGSLPGRAACRFAAGDVVRVVEGPFAGFSGRIARSRHTTRIEGEALPGGGWVLTVDVAIFGRATPVEFIEAQVQPMAVDRPQDLVLAP